MLEQLAACFIDPLEVVKVFQALSGLGGIGVGVHGVCPFGWVGVLGGDAAQAVRAET